MMINGEKRTNDSGIFERDHQNFFKTHRGLIMEMNHYRWKISSSFGEEYRRSGI